MKNLFRSDGSAPVPGDGLLHPVPLASVCLLLVNDHYLKHAKHVARILGEFAK